MPRKDRTSESIGFKFVNPYTNEEEEYDYYLDFEDIVEAIKLYANYYDVTLDGTDGRILELFASLDAGKYDYINEIFEKVVENNFVQEHLSEKLVEKAKEAFLEEKETEEE